MTFKKFAFATSLGASASLLSLSIALAADLPSRKAPLLPPPPVFTWDGFYFGVNAGYQMSGSNGLTTVGFPDQVVFGQSSTGLVGALATTQLPLSRQSGFIGGGQFGVNKQLGSFVVGVEQDIQFLAGDSGRGAFTGAFFDPTLGTNLAETEAARRKVDWLSTSRLRAGYLLTPTFLLYGTAGLASGRTKSAVVIGQNYAGFGTSTGFGFGNYSQTRVGYSIGAGVEWMFLPGWSLKAEYLYYDLGRANYQTTSFGALAFAGGLAALSSANALASTRFNGQIGRIGLNYHWDWAQALRGPLGGLAPTGSGALASTAWDGIYVGANAGYTSSSNNSITSSGIANPNLVALPTSSGTFAGLATFQLPVGSKGGLALGGQVGSNYQFNSFVVGFETDFTNFFINSNRGAFTSAATDPSTGLPGVQIAAAEKRIEWLSTSRLRAGYLITPTFLLYATGGEADGKVRLRNIISQNFAGVGLAGGNSLSTYSQTRVGYSVGGGGEWMFLPNWSLKGEYLYYDLGRVQSLGSPSTILATGVSLASASAVSATRFNGHLARAGINYHWNWGSIAPVVARY